MEQKQRQIFYVISRPDVRVTELCYREIWAVGPQEVADYYREHGFYTPLAWTQDSRCTCGEAALRDALDAALKAGRTLEKVDDRYIARGVSAEAKPEAIVPPKMADAILAAYEASKDPVLVIAKPDRDLPRPPLAYYGQQTRFDPFKGFFRDSDTGGERRCSSGGEYVLRQPQHALQRLSATDTALVSPAHALAAAKS